MNTYKKISVILFLIMIGSLLAIGQSITPPKPAKAVDTLKYPEKVEDMKIIKAGIPQHVKFGIITSVEGTVQESYNFKASVRDIKDQKLQLLSQNNKSAELTYKLPEGMKLNIKARDNITLYKNAYISGSGQAWDQFIKTNKDLKMAASKLYGDKLLESQPMPGVIIKQTGIDKDNSRETEYMKTSNVLLVLTQRSGNTPLKTRQVNEVIINRITYLVYVQASSYTEALPKSIEPEFQGYLLEYYMVEK